MLRDGTESLLTLQRVTYQPWAPTASATHHARVLMRQKRVGSMALSRCTWGTQQFSLLPERATLNLPAVPDVDTYPQVRTEPSLRAQWVHARSRPDVAAHPAASATPQTLLRSPHLIIAPPRRR